MIDAVYSRCKACGYETWLAIGYPANAPHGPSRCTEVRWVPMQPANAPEEIEQLGRVSTYRGTPGRY